MSNGAFKIFTFGDGDDHIGQKSKPWKGEGGNSYRFSFIWYDGLDKGTPDLTQAAPRFTGAPCNYLQGVGYFVNAGPEYTKIAGQPPRNRVATIIVVWPTDKSGDIDKTRLGKGDIEVQAWVFSDEVFKNLKKINKEFPFSAHDLSVTCTETQFQKLTYTPCKDSMLATFMAKPVAKPIVDKVMMKAQDVLANINSYIGREMTVQQIREKLAGGGAPGRGPAPSAAALASSTVEAVDLDGLVDGLLDSE
jgi:hypothetical protein